MNSRIYASETTARTTKRRRFGLAIIAALAIAAATFIPSQAFAVQVQYMQMPGSGNFSSPTTFNLPGYGNVQVTEAAEPATYWDQTGAYNQGAGSYTWGTDTQRLNVLNTQPGNINYTATFNFLNGAPDLSKLLVVPVGLAYGTTATINQQGSLVGEYSFGGITSTTLYNSGTFSSLGDHDRFNTGWALFQLDQNDGPISSISLAINQISGDGIGFTLGYVNDAPEPSSLLLMGSGIAGLGSLLRRRLARND